MSSDVMTKNQVAVSTASPEQVLESIVNGINSGDLDSLMHLYENRAAFATEPGTLSHGPDGVREALGGFISMKGTLALEVTRVLEVDDLAFVAGVWSFDGTGPGRRRGPPGGTQRGRAAPSGRRQLALRDRQPLGHRLNGYALSCACSAFTVGEVVTSDGSG